MGKHGKIGGIWRISLYFPFTFPNFPKGKYSGKIAKALSIKGYSASISQFPYFTPFLTLLFFIAYKKGDLLALTEANVASHATDEKTWDVICGRDVTAAEATAMVTNGVEFDIFYAGKFNAAAVSLNGTKLAANKIAAARAKAIKNRIELAKV